MEKLGGNVVARLKLDRIYYSPTGWSQRDKNRENVLKHAEATHNREFADAMRRTYIEGLADFAKYKAAHDSYRLDDFLTAFTESARRVLGDSKPHS